MKPATDRNRRLAPSFRRNRWDASTTDGRDGLRALVASPCGATLAIPRTRLLRPPASHAAKDPNTVAGTQLLVQLLRPFVGFRHLPDERDGARIREC